MHPTLVKIKDILDKIFLISFFLVMIMFMFFIFALIASYFGFDNILFIFRRIWSPFTLPLISFFIGGVLLSACLSWFQRLGLKEY